MTKNEKWDEQNNGLSNVTAINISKVALRKQFVHNLAKKRNPSYLSGHFLAGIEPN